ncbi:hypothetical protein C5167_042653 [Papaver somniferum]|uniref:Uncharacterized protein n=1 Tax=Papaver somniferum TaxID=3469 RepID=A0A4Y7L560_PAPSO|nr:hypothetical protein C5167_042653 [Papaver somniferum]
MDHTRISAPLMLQKLGCDSDMMDTELRNVGEKLGFRRKKVGGSGKNLHLLVKNPVWTGIPEAREPGKKGKRR